MKDDVIKLIALDESYNYRNARNFIPSELLNEMPSPDQDVIDVYHVGDGVVSTFGEGCSWKVNTKNLIWTGMEANTWFLKRPEIISEAKDMDYYKRYVTVQGLPTNMWGRNRDPSDIIAVYIDEPEELHSTRPEKASDWVDRTATKMFENHEPSSNNVYSKYTFTEAVTEREKAREEKARDIFTNEYLKLAASNLTIMVRILDKFDKTNPSRRSRLVKAGDLPAENKADAIFNLMNSRSYSNEVSSFMGSLHALMLLANTRPGSVLDGGYRQDTGEIVKYKFDAQDKAIAQDILMDYVNQDWWGDFVKNAEELYDIKINPGGEGASTRRAHKLLDVDLADSSRATERREDAEKYKHRREEKPGRFDVIGRAGRSLEDRRSRKIRSTKGWFDLVILTDDANYQGAVLALLQRLDKRSRVSVLRTGRIKNAAEQTGQKLVVKALRFKRYEDQERKGEWDIHAFRDFIGENVSKGYRLAVVSDNFTAKQILGGERTRSDAGTEIDSRGMRLDKDGNVTDVEVSKDDISKDPNITGHFIVSHNGVTKSVNQRNIVSLGGGKFGVNLEALTGQKVATPKSDRKDIGIRGAFRKAYDKVVKGDKVGGLVADKINAELGSQDEDMIDKGEEGMNMIQLDKAAQNLGKKRSKYLKKKSLRDHL